MTDTDEDDDELLDGWHQVPVLDEDATCLLRCSQLAHLDAAQRARLDSARDRPFPPLSTCPTCSPDVPDGVPTWL